jgi:dihydroneopterin aldolase
MQTWLIVNLRVSGFHRWKNAPPEFAYLGELHRHEFHINAKLKVEKNRAIEIISIKDFIHYKLFETFGYTYPNNSIVLDESIIDQQSVEGLAKWIADLLIKQYKVSKVEVTVLEDGENGATVCLEATEVINHKEEIDHSDLGLGYPWVSL